MAFFRKDASLNALATTYNVAQFVSFAPVDELPVQQYSRVKTYKANHVFPNITTAVEALIANSGSGTINIRSYHANEMQSREFLYGLSDVTTIVAHIDRHIEAGAFVIINETIDISDGGVSGVIMGDVIEFRPDATPRGVEQPGFASLPRTWAIHILETVYRNKIELPQSDTSRIEFSIHPKRSGWRQSHIIFWEYEELDELPPVQATTDWPNDFSRLIGDKAYGLLIASACGAFVPQTTVIARRVAPFNFGSSTGSGEVWLRTCPKEQIPGKFTTVLGWTDPFKLVEAEDYEHDQLASLLSQQSVPALWSGASLETQDGCVIIEGVEGFGDTFMQGTAAPQLLPRDVHDKVLAIANELKSLLGPVRFEWAFDGHRVWLLQLHKGPSSSLADVIVPGNTDKWIVFDIAEGLEALRQLISKITVEGILLNGNVGFTSHIADVVRKANIPTRIMPKKLEDASNLTEKS